MKHEDQSQMKLQLGFVSGFRCFVAAPVWYQHFVFLRRDWSRGGDYYSQQGTKSTWRPRLLKLWLVRVSRWKWSTTTPRRTRVCLFSKQADRSGSFVGQSDALKASRFVFCSKHKRWLLMEDAFSVCRFIEDVSSHQVELQTKYK